MAKTKSFKTLVQSHIKADKKFAEALLREGVDAMLSGDVETGKTILRDYIKATVGFEKLGAATGAPPKSLIRMFGPREIRRPGTCSAWSVTCRSGQGYGCTCRDSKRRDAGAARATAARKRITRLVRRASPATLLR